MDLLEVGEALMAVVATLKMTALEEVPGAEVAVRKMMASEEVLLASEEVPLEEFPMEVLVFLLVAAVLLLSSLHPVR